MNQKQPKIFDAHLHTIGTFLSPHKNIIEYMDYYNVEKAIITTTNKAASAKIYANKEILNEDKEDSGDKVQEAFSKFREMMPKGQLSHQDVIELANKAPERFYKFFWFNPMINPENEVRDYRVLENHFNNGFCGVKLHSGIHLAKVPRDITKLVDFMQEYNRNFPLYIHSTPKVSYFSGISCKDIAKLAQMYPNLIIIIGHAGMAMEYVIEEGLTLKKYSNIYFETSCSIPYAILALIKMLGHTHILFGSDAPITNPIQIEIDKINSLPIKNELKRDIFYNNTFELLKRL